MTKKSIREALLSQLKENGALRDHYEDLVADYMAFWDTKKALIKDIKDRGVTYKDFSSVGVEMQKNNPSVKELVMVNRQMLSLLKELGLSAEKVAGGGEDDEL